MWDILLQCPWECPVSRMKGLSSQTAPRLKVYEERDDDCMNTHKMTGSAECDICSKIPCSQDDNMLSMPRKCYTFINLTLTLSDPL